MNRLLKLEFLGPLALFGVTPLRPLAARALEDAPRSELLWFVNLRMFGIFQRSHAPVRSAAGRFPVVRYYAADLCAGLRRPVTGLA
ncbi:hypothetical protein [Bradyrhizobium paxllaeri]|uniref:hypothetical protein n=1 Tax=Bradyrhizobium paxllaeri TaxID=190148 RepID=UPI000810393D|nr:hypothetical protein [Bradyrhizobium paxllaeri]